MSEEKIVVERTYRATVEEIWDLWTTKDGFESWWGPQGFRVVVHEIDPRVGGQLRYDMVADAPEMVEAMKKMGRPASTPTRATYSALERHVRLALTHVMDFIPGVKAYDNTMLVELHVTKDGVRMVVMLSAMHSPEMTRMQKEGFTSQLGKLDRRFAKPM